MNLELKRLTINDEAAFKEGLKLFSDMESEWYSFVWHEGMTFEDHLKILDCRYRGEGLRPGNVPDSMLYAFYEGKIVGRSSIRHELNDLLIKTGGNIGYAVATTYRKRGFATEILKQSLNYCRDVLNLEQVLITCDDDNIASAKTIEKNGGLLENKVFSESENKLKRRYWIIPPKEKTNDHR